MCSSPCYVSPSVCESVWVAFVSLDEFSANNVDPGQCPLDNQSCITRKAFGDKNQYKNDDMCGFGNKLLFFPF